MRKRIFKELDKGEAFTTQCDTPYIKNSSRTAKAGKGHPAEGRIFYFGLQEIVKVKQQ